MREREREQETNSKAESSGREKCKQSGKAPLFIYSHTPVPLSSILVIYLLSHVREIHI